MSPHSSVLPQRWLTVVLPAVRPQDGVAVAFRRGDPAALAQVVSDHEDRVRRLVFRLGGFREAEDVVQEVFLVAWESRARFDPSRDLGAWLLGVTIRVFRARSRWWNRRRREAPLLDDHREVRGSEPADGLMRAEESRAVMEAVRSLPLGQREVLLLRVLEGWDPETIADRLGISRRAVDTRWSRATQRLRQAVGIPPAKPGGTQP